MVLQAYTKESIRSASILTTSYVAWTAIWQNWKLAEDNNQLLLYIDLTLWSLTSAEIKIEFSDDWVTYYWESVISISSWVASVDNLEYQFDTDWQYRLASQMKDRFVKVSAKGTGTVTGSSLEIYWIIGTA